MTICMEDIEKAFDANGTPRDVEAIFRAIIGFPSEDTFEGITLRAMLNLLDDTAGYLVDAKDAAIMPRSSVEAIENGGVPLLAASYLGGAMAVLANRSWWRAHLTASWGRRR